jgi:ribulose-phosphate 3-epimerase
MMEIIPGINEGDVKELERKVTIVAPHVDMIQNDVGDNTLFPRDTVNDVALLTPIIEKFTKTGTKFEMHLMVANPIPYLKPLADAGVARVIAHVECHDPREFLAEARTHEMEVGLALDVESDFELIEPYLEELDVVLIMTIETVASGQDFVSEALETIRTIHRNLPDLPIEVDGGMTPDTAKIVKEAGATRLVTTSYLFNNEQDIPSAIEALQNA